MTANRRTALRAWWKAARRRARVSMNSDNFDALTSVHSHDKHRTIARKNADQAAFHEAVRVVAGLSGQPYSRVLSLAQEVS